MRVTDQTLEIACRIPSDGTPTENTIHDLSLDLRDARQRIAQLEAALADCMGERAEELKEIEALQRALAFWHPGVPMDDPEMAARAGDDAWLLSGYDGLSEPSARELGWITRRSAPETRPANPTAQHASECPKLYGGECDCNATPLETSVQSPPADWYCPHCDCDLCGAVRGRLERSAAETPVSSMDYGGGPFDVNGEEGPNSVPETKVRHAVTCKLFPDPSDEREPIGPCTCGAETPKHEPRIRHHDSECHCSCGGPWPCPESKTGAKQ